MPRCRHCRTLLRRDPEEIGARCPGCREPLFEKLAGPEQVAEGATANLCAIHRRNVARGTCERCGNYFCQVCRTRLRGQTLCPGCAERVLESQEATPREGRAHLLQAILSIVLGVTGWGIVLLGFIMVGAGVSSESVILLGFGGLIMLASPLVAIVGAGQGAAAIRARGDHMILATIGLLLSAFQIGAVIGLFTFSALLND